MKQVLSIEQMKHLKELGLDTSDASMVLYVKTHRNFGEGWKNWGITYLILVIQH